MNESPHREMKESLKNILKEKLTFVYEDEVKVEQILLMIEDLVKKYEGISSKGDWLTEKDAMLITY